MVKRDIRGLDNTGYKEKKLHEAVPVSFVELLMRDGVLRHSEARLTPLTDGVSSEIYRVDDGDDSFVVKRALPKLRVREDWTANVDRNRYEQMYIEYVAGFLPRAVPALRPGPKDRGYFAMELLGPEFTSWKTLLLRGEASIEQADQAAAILGAIHARSAVNAEVAANFETIANFMQLRIDPYLLTTASRHPDLRSLIHAEAQRLASTKQCLVHGDFSPKNIMVSPSRMVLLDGEVAWYGDPAFDLAFLLTHLLLKGLYHAPRQMGLKEMCGAFWERYVEEVDGAIDCRALEPRVARLLPMLLLARVDGKSPVEYLTRPQQADWVRQFTRSVLLEDGSTLSDLLGQWFGGLKHLEARP
jgi:aminoglycoside phosphotransferase (APT) family kinase protein